MTQPSPTACLLVIGNEVLSGRTQDANIRHLAVRLGEIGIPLREVRVIPDVPDTIIGAVNECRARFDHVFTTGGIGPTHDDITADAVAEALGAPIDVRPDARRLLQAHYDRQGVPMNDARLRMGNRLAATIAEHSPAGDIDVVMPIPDSSRPSAMQVAQTLGIEYREGFYKNRYVGRTFIMPGQAVRKQSVRQKLNAMSSEFKGKNVLLIDDSIVRGTTSKQIVQMARDAGAKSVTFASAAPPVRYPHVYGINMPSRRELIASGRKIPEIARELGADHLIYQEVDDMRDAIIEGSDVTDLEMSCFTGEYVTGTVDAEYLRWVEANQLS